MKAQLLHNKVLGVSTGSLDRVSSPSCWVMELHLLTFDPGGVGGRGSDTGNEGRHVLQFSLFQTLSVFVDGVNQIEIKLELGRSCDIYSPRC